MMKLLTAMYLMIWKELNLGLPRNMEIEENRVYNLTEAFDLYFSLKGIFALSRPYMINPNLLMFVTNEDSSSLGEVHNSKEESVHIHCL